ncbi:MAG: CotH kinase family protein [Lachnospiraceae bacterium]|nr:CotH kinase family protein [Lachnospiraceae bacterium]
MKGLLRGYGMRSIAAVAGIIFAVGSFTACESTKNEERKAAEGVTQETPAPSKNEEDTGMQERPGQETPAPAKDKEDTGAPEEDKTGPGLNDTVAPVQEDKSGTVLPTVKKIEKTIDFSHADGFYTEEFDLELSINNALSKGKNGKIFYTLDGSDPALSDTAIEYKKALHISTVPGIGLSVSQVDPVLFSGNYSKVASDGYHFESTVKAPEESAVDRCTVIRAAVKYEDGSFGEESGGVYFVGSPEDHIPGISESCAAAGSPLAVINISMDYKDLFDSEKGIYVKGDVFNEALKDYIKQNGKIRDAEVARSLDANYKQHGKEWERTASLTMLEVNEEGAATVLSQVCGIRVQGNYSRSDLQKGFRLYARSDYGSKNFKYPVFGEDYKNEAGKKMDKFNTLVLRAGGNCAFTSKFNDVYWQSLLTDFNCETQKNRPCVVYVNGEYWGLYVLQEDYTNDYFEDKYGVDKSSVVVYKGDAETYACGYKLDEGKLPAGETEDYYFRELFDFFKTHKDLSSDEDYAAFCRIVDETSVMDYFAAEIWINNKWDWPGKNWSMWKAKPAGDYDGRWRFMFYDMEFGGVSGGSDARTNTVKEDNYKPEGLLDRNTDNPAVLCFAWLMTNKGFKDRFCERLTGLSEGNFEMNAALARLDEYEGRYSPLYDAFFLRYPGSGTTYNAVKGGYASIKCIRDFLKSRKDNISRMVDYINKLR